MKKKLILLATSLSCLVGYSQTTNNPSIGSFFSPLLSASNYIVAPYFTYAPNAPYKYGGGTLIIYNVNNYLGSGLGLDWLGRFSLVSGNLQLKYPINFKLFDRSWTITPFALGAIGIPYGGNGENNGQISTIEGLGASINLFKFKELDVRGGYAWVNWTDAGDYSGRHHEVFIAARLAF